MDWVGLAWAAGSLLWVVEGLEDQLVSGAVGSTRWSKGEWQVTEISVSVSGNVRPACQEKVTVLLICIVRGQHGGTCDLTAAGTEPR